MVKASDEGATKKKAAAEPARARRARAVADLLPDAGGAAFRRFGFVQSSIVSRWREIVGERYAAVSSPESIRFPPARRAGGVLTLVVEGAHAPMMQHVAPAIIERVNRFFGYPAVERVALPARHGSGRARRRPRAGAAVAAADPGRAGRFAARDRRSGASRLPRIACARPFAASDGGAGRRSTIPVVGRIGGERRDESMTRRRRAPRSPCSSPAAAAAAATAAPPAANAARRSRRSRRRTMATGPRSSRRRPRAASGWAIPTRR